MAACVAIEETFGWKLFTYLEMFPHHYDVGFSVGPQKVLVKALSVTLRASSKVFEREFKNRWEDSVVRDGDGEGICLPEFDPEAFKLFLKLMILDTWSVDVLQALELPGNQLLDLLAICRKYEMETAVRSLTELVTEFLRTFHNYVETEDSLELSYPQLETVVASNELQMNESEVFNYACRWAELECSKQHLEATGENLRLVLGSALYEIRFPLMTIQEFAPVTRRAGLLSIEEVSETIQLMAGGTSSSPSNDITKFTFKVEKRREKSLASTPTSTSSPTVATAATRVEKKNQNPVTSVPAGSSTVSLAQVFPVVDTPFVCGGINHVIYFNMEMKIALKGLGFLGPIDTDAFYDVTVQIWKDTGRELEVTNNMEKHIFARKSKTFYFFFDQPLVLDSIPHDGWKNYYYIVFSLKGPKTRSLQNQDWVKKRFYDGSKEFVIELHAPQLVEIVYNTV